MKLSAHFTLDEFTVSETAARKGIENTPDKKAVENLMSLCEEILEPLRRAAGESVHITSGYRSPELNKAVGGSKTSQHCEGLAADIRIRGIPPLEVCEMVDQLGLPYDQLIHEFGQWTHVSVARDGTVPRRQRLTIDRQGTRSGLLRAR